MINIYTQQQYDVSFQKIKEKHAKIEIMDKNDNVLGELQGIAISGSVSITNDSMIRRTADLKFMLYDYLLPTPTSLLWIEKRFRLSVGIKDFIKDEIVWFKLGIFIIRDPSVDVSVNGRTIGIKGYDKMLLFNKQLELKTIIRVNTPLHEAIKSLAILVGEQKQGLIDTSQYLIPYDIIKQAGEKIDDLLKFVTELYMRQQCYYNTEGYLVFEEYKNRVNDPIVWEFNDDTDTLISTSVNVLYSNVVNYVKVMGEVSGTTGIQPVWIEENKDPNNKFSTVNIDKTTSIITEDKYTNEEQCKQKAVYELENHTNMAEKINFTTTDIYLINDVNLLIKFNSDNLRSRFVDGIYLIDSINLSLEKGSTMQISAHKIYN